MPVSENREIPNPNHREDWPSAQQEAKAAFARASENFQFILAVSNTHPENAYRAHNDFVAAKNNLILSDRFPHKTVADYAAWLFETKPVFADWQQTQKFTPDFASFQTPEQVENSWRRIGSIAERLKLFNTRLLPSTRDALFSGGDVRSEWKTFKDRDSAFSTLVTAETMRGTVRFCFMHDPQDMDRRLCGAIERLATQIFREINKNSSAAAPSLRDIFDRPKIPANRFEFYAHIPPEAGIDECFCKIDMDFDGHRFKNSRWEKLAVIPQKVQMARFIQGEPAEACMDTARPQLAIAG